MIANPRSPYPADLMRAAHHEADGWETTVEDLLDSVKHYAQEKPTSALLIALGIGFVLGWRLKPW